jgi:aminopeptidase-like protein
MPQLIPPYKNNGHLTRQQINFNYVLSSVRSTVERAFGVLKKRMRCLKFLHVRCMDWIPKYVIACCVIHHICILQNDILELEPGDVQVDDDNNEEEGNLVEAELRRMGTQKRNLLCARLNN